MLSHLSVRDLVIVNQVSADLNAGLTVLTGETGAGKSIMVDALSLVLGARANAGLVRHGAERAEVTAIFSLDATSALPERLRELDLDSDEDELHLRRTVSTDGRSRAFVNGRPVPVQLLRELGSALVDVHGQHEHQSLLRTDTQRALVDEFGAHSKTVEQVRAAYEKWAALATEAEALRDGHSDHQARFALLEYQVEELDTAAPEAGEYAALLDELKRLSSTGELKHGCAAALASLRDSDHGNAAAQLAHTRGLLERLNDSELAGALEMLDTAIIHADEAATLIEDVAQQRELDPERLAAVESRLSLHQDIARKHHVRPDELAELLSTLTAELDAAKATSDRAAVVDGELQLALDRYVTAAAKLSKARKSAARRLAKAINATLGELGISGGTCEIRVEPLTPSVQDAGTASEPMPSRPRPTGLDDVQFLVAMNPGAPGAPLAKAASGGELSRISLAIQVQLAHGSGAPTLVFDEIDVGIGGGIAEVVGRKLRQVADSRQVLCVTHLAQVASQGAHHLRVAKSAGTDSAATQLEALDATGRVEEIARMIGGQDITKRTLAHAQEMLSLATNRGT